MTRKRVASALVVMVVTVSCTDSESSVSDAPRLHVILDYSPTLSDAAALLYLAAQPNVELLAVTLPGTGEADCEPGVRITRSLLVIADRGHVPIGCGREQPLVGSHDWPDEWRAASNAIADELPTVESERFVDAEQLLAVTLRDAPFPVTLVAVGPLTNLGVVLGEQPELAQRVARVVIMGGAVEVPGNVDVAPNAEWNFFIDPEAARRVMAADVEVTLVALDATRYVAWTDRVIARVGALDTAVADTVHSLAKSSGSLAGFYLWDELAAMVAVDPSVVKIERKSVRIDDDGAVIEDSSAYVVDVAVSAVTATAIDAFITGLNHGIAPPDLTMTAAELDYLEQLATADAQLQAAVGEVFEAVDSDDPDVKGAAAAVIEGFVAAVEDFVAIVDAVVPPPTLSGLHAEFIESLSNFVEGRDSLLAAVVSAQGSDLNAVLDEAITSGGLSELLNDVNLTCQALAEFSLLREGPVPCSAGG